MANELVTVKLNRNDVGQIVDGLTARAELYECTQRYYEQDGYLDPADCPEIAECKDAAEAKAIAEHYRAIIKTLAAALESKHSHDCPSHIGQGCECGAGFGRPPQITIRSSHGYFKVDAQGDVMERVIECPEVCADGCLPDVRSFDFAEWRKYWNQSEMAQEIDILDLGYWYGAGQYEEPANDWREEFRKMKKS